MMKKYISILKISLILLLITFLLSCKKDDAKDVKTENDNTKTKVTSTTNNNTEGIKWFAYDEGIKKAKVDNKFIFIDFYSKSCGYCKKLESETYSNKKIYEYVQKNFIPIRVDLSSNKKIVFEGKDIVEQDIAMIFGVNATPTLFFLTPKNEMIGNVPGFLEATEFYSIASYIATNSYKTQSIKEFKEKQKI